MTHLHCPITGRVMIDPVVAQDGYTYERVAVEWFFQVNGVRSPVTGLSMANRDLIPNRAFAKAVSGLSTARNKVRYASFDNVAPADALALSRNGMMRKAMPACQTSC